MKKTFVRSVMIISLLAALLAVYGCTDGLTPQEETTPKIPRRENRRLHLYRL